MHLSKRWAVFWLLYTSRLTLGYHDGTQSRLLLHLTIGSPAAFSVLFLSGVLLAPISQYHNVELPYAGAQSERAACPRLGAADSLQKQAWMRCVLVHQA